MIWYKEKNENDIMVSTRIRLARNLSKYPFPTMLNDEGRKKATEEITAAVINSNSVLSKEFKAVKMSELTHIERTQLAEKHLISLDMAKNDKGTVLISRDETMSIMLMEEDHIRLQIIKAGFGLSDAYSVANKVDDVIEESLGYAFSEEFGYLTACPSNTGTGIRASVMMHLPALTVTENINKVITSASALGLTVRGLYGEGSKAYGSLYQLSNQITLGMSEEEIIAKLEQTAKQIEKLEREAREKIKDITSFADKISRSYGILKYAKRVSSKEAKSLLSDVILAKNLGIIEIEEKLPIWQIVVETEPALLAGSEDLTADERDKKRAEILSANL